MALFDALAGGPGEVSPEWVHRLRVAVKQTRAWLKLCHVVTGDTPAYRQLVQNLRQLSHALSGLRDREVALTTLAGLARKYPGKKAGCLIEDLCRQLVQTPVVIPDNASLKLLIEQIRRDLPVYAHLMLAPETQHEELDRRYLKMCKAGKRALHTHACSDLHVWRKRVKTLAYQLALAPHSPPSRRRMSARLNKLGHRLGELHDLCFLQTMVEEMAATSQPPLKATPVLERIQRERHRLIESGGKHYRRLCSSP